MRYAAKILLSTCRYTKKDSLLSPSAARRGDLWSWFPSGGCKRFEMNVARVQSVCENVVGTTLTTPTSTS